MIISFLGNFGVDYSSENHHKKSLEALGHTVKPLQEREATGEEVLSAAIESDLFVWIHTHGWRTPGLDMRTVLKTLKRANVPTMTYHLDLWFGIEREKDLHSDWFYKEIGHFFATDKLMCDWFNENTEVKGHYLPAGVYHEECYISGLMMKQKDIIFVGSKGYHPEWQYRPQLIDWLGKNYAGFTHVGGDGQIPTTRGDALNQMYANTKIAVGDTLCINFDYPYYFSDRLFETTGRGGFLIFPYIKGIEDCFEIDKEIVTYEFGNFDQLKEKIDYYLTHDEEREAIRKAGHERTKRDHTYLKRWEAIIKELGLDQA